MPASSGMNSVQPSPINIMEQSGALLQYDLSIVVVSYNTLEMTRECLASVMDNRAGLTVQVVVVDNNSEDGSAVMIKTVFPDVLLIENPDNRGFAAANNQGFALCSGKYILLLNSDTVILDSVLRDSVDYLQKNEQAGAMGCQVLNPDRTIQFTCSGYPTLVRLVIMTLALDRIPGLSFLDHYLMRTWKRDHEREVEVISGCYLMIRKEILATIGPFDESFFFFGEETDLCRRIRDGGWNLVFAPVGRIIHYGGGSIKKLQYKRDVMLTSALVRLHKKHGGLLQGIYAFLILTLFNFSRAVFWSIVAIFITSKKEKARHFIQVALSIKSCWHNYA